FIRRVTNLSDSGRLIPFEGEAVPRISYNKSYIRILFASPSYGYAEKKFQVKLEGFDEQWSAPSPLSYKEYTHLPAGTYTFHVRLAEEAGTVVRNFSFKVLPPWYASWWAWVLYLLVAVLVVAYFRRRYRRKIMRRHEAAMERFRHEKEERVIELEN